MRVYTVHIADGPTEPAVADAVLVKEGFSWPGFFLSAPWALWHRLWWVALGLAVVEIAVGLGLEFSGAGGVAGAAVSLGVAVLIGASANDLRRWTLARNGRREAMVVAGDDGEMAYQRFLARSVPASITLGPRFTGDVR